MKNFYKILILTIVGGSISLMFYRFDLAYGFYDRSTP